MSEMYDIDRQTSARNDIEAFVYIFVIGTICNTRNYMNNNEWMTVMHWLQGK